MTTPPMRTRRSRPPGFATRRDDESSPEGVIARAPQLPSPVAPGAEAAPTNGTAPGSAPVAPETRQREATQPRPPRGRARPVTPEGGGNPYAGAATRQFNTRLLEPLHQRYMRLVRDLADEGYEISMTELVHALLHEGPTTTAEARAKVRAWRQLRASE
jgi:hypothetical protein